MDIKATAKIYIIESPSKQDCEQGRFEGKALTEILHLAQIRNDYHEVSDRQDLIKIFELISEDVNKNKEENSYVTIHLSLHGNRKGIALKSGEFLSWKEFSVIWMKNFTDRVGYFKIKGQTFCPVNLCFSACEALAAKEMRNYSSSSPYFILVAPTIPIDWSDSLMAFAVLYHTIIHKNAGTDKAIERMNLVNGLDNVFQFDIIEGWGILS